MTEHIIRYLFMPVRAAIGLVLIAIMTIVFLLGACLYPNAGKDYKESLYSILRFVRNGIESY
jgi:hypothetical protein